MKQDRITDTLLPSAVAPGTRIGNALLWKPQYVRDRNILWHLPFLFWLIEAVRPQHYLEVGVGDGVAYMAACQAFHRLRLHSKCSAVGNWDDNDRVPEHLASRNANLYDDFSQILAGGLERSAQAVEDQSVDLMLVDLTEAPEAARLMTDTWLPKLSKAGILLINGMSGAGEATVSLVQRLTNASPTLQMPGGDGLLVVLPGASDDLANIAALSPEDPAHALIVQLFTRLGAGTFHEVHSDRAKGLADRIDSLIEEQDTLTTRLETRDRQYDERHRKLAVLQSRCFDSEIAIETMRADAKRVDAELSASKAAADRALELLENERVAHAQLREQFELAQARIGSLTEDGEVLGNKLAELADSYAEAEKNHQLLSGDLAAERARHERSAAMLQRETAAREEAHREREEAMAFLELERVAQQQAQEASEEARALLDQMRAERDELEDRHGKVLTESAALRDRVGELILPTEKSYDTVKGLVAALEEYDDLLAAVTDEVRRLRSRAEPSSTEVEQPAEDHATSEANSGLLNRMRLKRR